MAGDPEEEGYEPDRATPSPGRGRCYDSRHVRAHFRNLASGERMTTSETVEVRRPRGRAILANWGPTLLFNVALPMFTYFLLTGMGVGAVPALLASGVWPVVEMGLSLAVRRHMDEISVLVLIFIVLGVVAGLGFN